MCNIYLCFLLHKSWGIPSSKKNRGVNVKSVCRMFIIWFFTPCQNVNIFGYSQNICVISYLPTPPPTFLFFWTVNKFWYHQWCSKKTFFCFPVHSVHLYFFRNFFRNNTFLTNPKLLNGSVIMNSNISYVIACINNNQIIQIMLRLKRQMKRCSYVLLFCLSGMASYNWNLTCKSGHFAFHGDCVWAEKQFSPLHIISWVLMWANFRWLFLVIFNCMFWIWFEWCGYFQWDPCCLLKAHEMQRRVDQMRRRSIIWEMMWKQLCL